MKMFALKVFLSVNGKSTLLHQTAIKTDNPSKIMDELIKKYKGNHGQYFECSKQERRNLILDFHSQSDRLFL